MASRTDDIEREIAERRNKLSLRADNLRSSARDLQSASQSIPQSLWNDSGLSEQIQQRPLICVGAALAAGVLLGVASESVFSRDGKNRDGNGSARSRDSGLLGGVMGVVETAAVDELRRLVSEMLGRRESSAQPAAAPSQELGAGAANLG